MGSKPMCKYANVKICKYANGYSPLAVRLSLIIHTIKNISIYMTLPIHYLPAYRSPAAIALWRRAAGLLLITDYSPAYRQAVHSLLPRRYRSGQVLLIAYCLLLIAFS